MIKLCILRDLTKLILSQISVVRGNFSGDTERTVASSQPWVGLAFKSQAHFLGEMQHERVHIRP